MRYRGSQWCTSFVTINERLQKKRQIRLTDTETWNREIFRILILIRILIRILKRGIAALGLYLSQIDVYMHFMCMVILLYHMKVNIL